MNIIFTFNMLPACGESSKSNKVLQEISNKNSNCREVARIQNLSSNKVLILC